MLNVVYVNEFINAETPNRRRSRRYTSGILSRIHTLFLTTRRTSRCSVSESKAHEHSRVNTDYGFVSTNCKQLLFATVIANDTTTGCNQKQRNDWQTSTKGNNSISSPARPLKRKVHSSRRRKSKITETIRLLREWLHLRSF